MFQLILFEQQIWEMKVILTQRKLLNQIMWLNKLILEKAKQKNWQLLKNSIMNKRNYKNLIIDRSKFLRKLAIIHKHNDIVKDKLDIQNKSKIVGNNIQDKSQLKKKNHLNHYRMQEMLFLMLQKHNIKSSLS